MLTLEAVSYRYAGATKASLRDVSLTLHDGEVLGVVGRSEAGKSTLCLVASGLAPRTLGGTLSGRLLVDGVDAAGRPMHEMASEVAIGFQNPGTQLSGVATHGLRGDRLWADEPGRRPRRGPARAPSRRSTRCDSSRSPIATRIGYRADSSSWSPSPASWRSTRAT